MPAPTSYNESALATYVVVVLSNVAGALGWTSGTPQVLEAVHDAIYAYGPTDTTVHPPTYTIALMTDMLKLRAFARREAWRQALNALAAAYDFAADGQSFKRSQLYAQAERQYSAAYSDALAFDSYADTILPATVNAATNPYAPENVGREFG